MTEKLQKLTEDIGEHRAEIIDKLVQFSLTDMLLFWGQEKDLIARQEEEWAPLLKWAQQELDAQMVTTHGLNVPEENKASGYKLKKFMEGLSDKELVAFYAAALNMRSVLLAAALVKGRINAEQAFKAAYLEELWQSENWGTDEDSEKRRGELKEELLQIEHFLRG